LALVYHGLQIFWCMSNETYHYKRVSKSSLPDLQKLYKEVFNLNYSLDFIEKKIDTLTGEAAYLGYLAYHKSGEVAGYYGLLACFKTIEGEKTLCAQSADTMVSKAHQGQGLFKVLYDLTFELAKNVGVKFLFGYPNTLSYPLFIKALKWDNPRSQQVHLFEINTFPLAKFFYKYNQFESVYIKIVQNIFNLIYKKSNQFTDESVKASAIYKLKNGRNFIIQIDGSKVWLSVLNGIWIGKIEGQLTYLQVIEKIKPLCFLLGLSQIRIAIDSELDNTNYSELASKTIDQPLIIKYIDESFKEKNITFEGFEGDMF